MPYKDKEKQKAYLKDYYKNNKKLYKKYKKSYSKTYYYENQEAYAKAQKEYYKRKVEADGNTKFFTKNRVAWGIRNKHKLKAHKKLNYAVKVGKIIRLPCQECGNTKSEAHHEDYSKPLDVIWLCKQHHGITRRKVLI